MADYDFNNILETLRGGAKIDDVMAEFTKVVNAAVEAYDNENRVLNNAYATLAEAWNDVAVAYVDKHGMPEGVPDIDDLFIDADEAEKMFEGIVSLDVMLRGIKEAFDTTSMQSKPKAKAKPKTDSDDINAVFENFFRQNNI